MKKAKAGKILGSRVSFSFKNNRLTPVQGVHVIFSANIIAIEDSGGFQEIKITDKKVIDAVGKAVGPGDSVVFTALFKKKEPGTLANYWWWTDANGDRRSSTEIKHEPILDEQKYIQPNGGNVLNYVYKNFVFRPDGLLLGLKTDYEGLAWVRNFLPNQKYFPHTGEPRCFDALKTSSGMSKPFIKKKNLYASKHNNHLAGELHALKLAILSNDAGITEPTEDTETKLGDLLYHNPSDASDPNNGMTLRQIALRTDSMLTFCGFYSSAQYVQQDVTLSMINQAFDGPYQAVSFEPFVLGGAQSLNVVPFLHTNIDAPPVTRPTPPVYSIVEETPERFEIQQNYPNPFNPTTTIEFSLAQPSLVTMKVYNMLGQEVATLVDNEELDNGAQQVEFDANNLTSGVYFYKLVAQGIDDEETRGEFFQATKRMLLVK
jgi:hypothetical protein